MKYKIGQKVYRIKHGCVDVIEVCLISEICTTETKDGVDVRVKLDNSSHFTYEFFFEYNSAVDYIISQKKERINDINAAIKKLEELKR